MVFKRFFILIFCLSVSSSSWAIDDDVDTLSTIYLNNSVIISAQRYETDAFERPESVAFLSKAQLKHLSPMSMPEALSYVAGVWMQKTNHGGGSAFVRGLTGYQTLLMVDGIRLNNSTYRSGPNQYLNTIDPLMISNIEVLRGGGSVQYGSDAIGGTIHMLSLDPVFSKRDTLILFTRRSRSPSQSQSEKQIFLRPLLPLGSVFNRSNPPSS